MDYVVPGVFVLVYLGMILGEFPGLRLDRTGIALLGAIVLIASERLSIEQAWTAIDVPTMALLLALMVVSAQFRLGGFYTLVTRDTRELDFAHHRQMFLPEQGYSFAIQDERELLPPKRATG